MDIMTQNATFCGSPDFQTCFGAVVLNAFDAPQFWEVKHVALPPSTSRLLRRRLIIAKMANGIADDMLSTVPLATRAPILIAPAMNTVCDNPATKKYATPSKRGHHFVYKGVCLPAGMRAKAA